MPIWAYIVIIKDFVKAISKLRVQTKLEEHGKISSKAKYNNPYKTKGRVKSESKVNVPQEAHQRLYRYLGDETADFLKKVQKRLEKYTRLWQLSDLSFIPTDAVNLLLFCESKPYGSCVLKICIPGPEVATEVNCLLAYEGREYCKLWAYDLSDDVLLLERIYPGDQMWAVEDYRKRARLMGTVIIELKLDEMATIYCGKEASPSKKMLLEQYPTYLTWLERVYCNLAKKGDLEEMLFYLDKVMEVYTELKERHPRVCLLHGDLHQKNMLRNEKGGYTIIDPKGVVDTPVMETARFLRNETLCREGEILREENKIREMVAVMSPIIGFPKEDLLKGLFIDTALSCSWTLEEHFSTEEAFKEEKKKALEACEFAYGLLKRSK